MSNNLMDGKESEQLFGRLQRGSMQSFDDDEPLPDIRFCTTQEQLDKAVIRALRAMSYEAKLDTLPGDVQGNLNES